MLHNAERTKMLFYDVLLMCFICDLTKFRGGLMTLWELLSVSLLH